MAFSVLRKPLLSAAEIRSWPAKGAAIVGENNDSCIVSYGNLSDTAWVYTIDKKSNLIVGLDLRDSSAQRDTILLNTWYVYKDTAGVHVPRLIALRGDTTLGHGGYRFSNITFNDSLPDSLFVAPNRVRNVILFQSGVFSFVQYDDILSIGFSRLTHDLRVRICDISGRLFYSRQLSPGTRGFVWRGESSSGMKLPAGKYVVNLNGENIHFSRGCTLQGR